MKLLEHARQHFGPAAFFAGVTHGNDKSRAVLVGLGYQPELDHADYTLFARSA